MTSLHSGTVEHNFSVTLPPSLYNYPKKRSRKQRSCNSDPLAPPYLAGAKVKRDQLLSDTLKSTLPLDFKDRWFLQRKMLTHMATHSVSMGKDRKVTVECEWVKIKVTTRSSRSLNQAHALTKHVCD